MEKTCRQCGNLFTKNPKASRTQWEFATYCSRRCSSKSISPFRLGHKPWNTGIKTNFVPSSAYKKQDSRITGKNAHNWKGGPPKCEVCSKQLAAYSARRCKKHPATPQKRGAEAHGWRGGTTPLYKIMRASKEYSLWRIAVFERDNYTCTWCGDRNYEGRGETVELQADHIKPFYLYPELRLVIDNGRTLCRPCHKKTGTWGRPKARFDAVKEQEVFPLEQDTSV